MPTARLALKSLWNRRATAALTLAAIAVSVALLLGVQKMRQAAREGFANTLSGVDLIVGAQVGPALGKESLAFMHRYPASQAALARLDPEDRRVALRFELYHRGMELANGYHELTDLAEQRQRFAEDQRIRERRGLPVSSLDPHLLAALEAGMPDCAGVALGFDRVLMLAMNASSIDDVLAFPVERA